MMECFGLSLYNSLLQSLETGRGGGVTTGVNGCYGRCTLERSTDRKATTVAAEVKHTLPVTELRNCRPVVALHRSQAAGTIIQHANVPRKGLKESFPTIINAARPTFQHRAVPDLRRILSSGHLSWQCI